MSVQDDFTFFAPELLKEELQRYNAKIIKFSKLDSTEITKLKLLLFSNMSFVSEELISEKSWSEAFELTKDIDEDDTPFVALSIEISAVLWTGDKVLSKGLLKKRVPFLITSKELQERLL